MWLVYHTNILWTIKSQMFTYGFVAALQFVFFFREQMYLFNAKKWIQANKWFPFKDNNQLMIYDRTAVGPQYTIPAVFILCLSKKANHLRIQVHAGVINWNFCAILFWFSRKIVCESHISMNLWNHINCRLIGRDR